MQPQRGWVHPHAYGVGVTKESFMKLVRMLALTILVLMSLFTPLKPRPHLLPPLRQ
jgi:hypothetical protein